MNKTLKIVLVVAVVLIAIVLVAPLLLGGLIASKVESALASSMDSDVEIDGLSYWWFSGLAADGIDIRARKAGGMDVQLAEVEATPAIGALLGGNVEIHDLRAKGLVVTLRPAPAAAEPAPRGDEGSRPGDAPRSEPAPAAEPERRELPDVDVRGVVEDVTVIWDSPAYERPMRLDHLRRIEATIATGAPIELTLEDPALSGRATIHAFDGNLLRAVDDIDAEATVTADSGDLARFADLLAPWMTLRGGTLDVDERLERRDGITTVKGTMRLSDLDAVDRFKEASHAIGSITLDVDLRTDAAFATTGDVRFAIVDVRSHDLPALDEPLRIAEATLVAKLLPERRLRVESARIDGELLRLDAGGEIAWGGTLPRGDFTARIEAEVDRLARVLQDRRDMSGTLLSELTLKTDASGATTVRGGTTITGLRAQPLREGMAPIDEREVRLRHDLAMTDEVLTIENLSLDASFARLAATGSLDFSGPEATPEGRIDLQGSADLAALSTLAGSMLPGSASGRVDVQGGLEGDGAGMKFDLRADSPALVVQSEAMQRPLDLGAVSARVTGTVDRAAELVEVPTLALQSSFCTLEGSLRHAMRPGAEAKTSLQLGGRADLARLAATLRPETTTPGLPQDAQLRLELEKTGTRTSIGLAELQTGTTRATLEGTVDTAGEAAAGDLTFTAKGRMEDLAPLIPGAEPMSGSGALDAQGTIRLGADKTFRVTGRAEDLALAGGALGDRRLEAATAELELDGKTRADGGLEIAPLRAELAQALLGKLDATTLRGDFVADARVESSGGFVADLRGENLAIRKPADAEFRAMSSGLVAHAEGLRDAESGTWRIDRMTLDGEGIEASGKAAYAAGERMTFDLGADVDAAALSDNWLAVFLDDVAGRGEGRLDLKADVPLGDRRDDATGTLVARMDELTVAGVTLTDLDLQGAMEGGVGRLSKGDARINGGPATVDLRADLREEVALWHLALEARDVAVEKTLQPALARAIPIFAGLETSVQTKVGLRLELDGRGSDMQAVKRSLTGDGTLTAAAGTVEGGPLLQGLMTLLGLPPRLDFSAIATDILVQDGAVIQEGLTLDGNLLDIRLGGRTSFEGELDYTLGVKPEQGRVKEFDRFAAILTSDGFLPLGLGGDVRSPSVALPDPAQLIGTAVERRLKEGIGGLLEGATKEGGGGLLEGLLGGKKEQPARDEKKPAEGEKKPADDRDRARDLIEGLGGLLGGDRKKDAGGTKR